jgi:hypothetical protein
LVLGITIFQFESKQKRHRPKLTSLYCEAVVLMGLDSGMPKGHAHAPPKRLKKRRAGAARLPIQACKPPHAARRPHAYKWREDGRLGVWPRRTGVQALHALRTGVHGQHACPARLT